MFIHPATGFFNTANSSYIRKPQRSTCLYSTGGTETWRAVIHRWHPGGRRRHHSTFCHTEEGKKKSSRIMWLLHSAVAALLEMFSNERKEELLTSSLRTVKSPRATCIMGNITFSRVWYHIINNDTNAAVLLFNATMKRFTLSVPLSVYDQLRLTSSDKAFSVQSRHQTDEILSTYQWLVSCLNLQRAIHVTWLISDSHDGK